MQRIQLQQRLKFEQFFCSQCKKQSSIYYNLLTIQQKIICYDCTKNNQLLLTSIKSPFKNHYQLLFNNVPTPDIAFAQQFLQQLERMKLNSIQIITQYKLTIKTFQSEIQQFYTETKIICNAYINKIKLLIQKSQKSIIQLIDNIDKINQNKYIKNLKIRYKISNKIQDLLSKIKPSIISIKQLQLKEQTEIQRNSICQVPIHSLIEIKGSLYYGTADGRIVYQNTFNSQIKEIKAHQSLIRSLAYDGQYKLYSGSDDFKIKAWDLHTHQLKFIAQFGIVPDFKSYHRDIIVFNYGKTLASTRGQFDSFKIRLWELNAYKNIRQLQGHDNYIRAMTINFQQQLVTVSDDKTLKVWNTKTCESQRIFYHYKKLQDVFCNKQRNLIGVVDQENKIIILNDKSLQIVHGWNIGKKILCSYGKHKLYFGVSSSILVYSWNGVKIGSFPLDINFLPGVLLEIDNKIIVCDGKGKSLEIPLKNHTQILQ